MDRENREKGSIIPLIAVVVLLVVGVGLYFAKPFLTSKPNKVSTSPTPTTPVDTSSTGQVNSNLPPLYPGVEWGEPVEGNVVFSTENNESIKLNGYAVKTEEISSYNNLITYYKEALQKEGWEQVSYASGPNGESYEYNKDGSYFSFGALVHSNSPLTYKGFVSYSIK